jgi:hypothetical protein
VEWVFAKDAERVQAVFPGHLALADWFPEPAPLHVVYPQSRQLSRRVREHDGVQLRSTLPPA